MYWSGSATPAPSQSMDSPGSSVACGHATVTPRVSTTWMPESVEFPVFVTRYVQSTASPTGMNGPGASSASSSFVSFSRSIAPCSPK